MGKTQNKIKINRCPPPFKLKPLEYANCRYRNPQYFECSHAASAFIQNQVPVAISMAAQHTWQRSAVLPGWQKGSRGTQGEFFPVYRSWWAGVWGACGPGAADRTQMAPASPAAAFRPSWHRGGKAVHRWWVAKEKALGANSWCLSPYSSWANSNAALWGHWWFVLV